MKVKELLQEIKEYQKKYGKDFLEWEVYAEQCTEEDKKYKRGKQHWGILKGFDGLDSKYEYFECAGGVSSWLVKKALCIHINY